EGLVLPSKHGCAPRRARTDQHWRTAPKMGMLTSGYERRRTPLTMASPTRTGDERMQPSHSGRAFVAAAALCTGTAGAFAAERDLASICGECRAELFATCGGFLEGATFAADGTLWVVDLTSGNILTVRERGCEVRGNTGGAPNGAKFHRDGRLFIADKDRGVLAFDPASGALEVVADTYRAERLRGTNDLVFDADGGLYFTGPYGSSAIDPDGRLFYLPPGESASLTVAADGLAF